MTLINYQDDLKQHSKELRRNGTLGEVILWEQLRRRQMRGYQFNRQKPLGIYIVDFYCKQLNLVIEIDGSSHNHEIRQAKDSDRQSELCKLGLFVLRFGETEVRNEVDNVLQRIDEWITEKECGEMK